MNTNEMTVGEMMLHFRIAEEHYDLFSKWLTNNAFKFELVSPNNTKKIRKIYLVDKVEQLFPDKHIFNTQLLSEELQAAAELLSNAMQEHSNISLTTDEILRVLENHNRKQMLLQSIQHYVVEVIKWHDKTQKHADDATISESQCRKIEKRMYIISWLWVALLIVNIILTIWL